MVRPQIRSASCVDIHTQIVSYKVGRHHCNILSESLGLYHPRFNICVVWKQMALSYFKTGPMSYKYYSFLGSFTVFSHWWILGFLRNILSQSSWRKRQLFLPKHWYLFTICITISKNKNLIIHRDSSKFNISYLKKELENIVALQT